MVKDVRKASEGRIVRVSFAVTGEIGQVLRQWPVGSKHSKEIDEDSNETAPLSDRSQRRRRESQGRLLAEAEKILVQPGGSSNSRAVPKFSLQRSNGSKEIERKRLSNHRIDYAIGRLPILLGHRMISPRRCEMMTVSVNELTET